MYEWYHNRFKQNRRKLIIMEDVKLKYIDINEFKGKIYPYYLEIFSEKERKPFKLIQK